MRKTKFNTKYSNSIVARWVQDRNPKDRDILSELHTPLIVSIAKRYRQHFNERITFDDCVQEGHLGLLKAIEKFEADKGAAFPTYASIWILSKIRRYIDTNTSIVKHASTYQTRILDGHYAQTVKKCLQQDPHLEGESLLQAMAELEGFDVKHVRACASKRSPCMSLDAPVRSDGEGADRGEFMPDPKTVKIEDELNSVLDTIKMSKRVKNIEEKLDERERIILNQRIIAEEPETLQALGTQLNVSRERIRQIEVKVLKTLRMYYDIRYAA